MEIVCWPESFGIKDNLKARGWRFGEVFAPSAGRDVLDVREVKGWRLILGEQEAVEREVAWITEEKGWPMEVKNEGQGMFAALAEGHADLVTGGRSREMGDQKRIKEMDRRNTCLHESAHSVDRQLKIGNLGEVGIERKGTSYSYPVERKPLDEMDRDELAKIAVVVAAGVFAEDELCSSIGDQYHAVADDMRQWESIRRLGNFSDEETETFREEASRIVRAQERAIRRVALELDRRQRLTGEQVTRLLEAHRA